MLRVVRLTLVLVAVACLPGVLSGCGGSTGTAGGTNQSWFDTPTGRCHTSNSGNFLTPQAGARLIWHDDCTAEDPLPAQAGPPRSGYGAFVGGRADGLHNRFTNSISQISPGRLSRFASGGPRGLPYRQLTVVPGDQNWGTRDALGYNWSGTTDAGWGIPGPGPTVLWHQNQYRLLTLWLRLGAINTSSYFRQVVEIKQAMPYAKDPWGHGAMFELQQREGKWFAICQWRDAWTIPVNQPAGTWLPISVEGFFSADPNRGWIRFKIGNQISPIFRRQTLLRDTANGASVPSFMELGPYQDPALPTFSLGFADVRVYG